VKVIKEPDFIKEVCDLVYRIYSPVDFDTEFINNFAGRIQKLDDLKNLLNNYLLLKKNFQNEIIIDENLKRYFLMTFHHNQSILSFFCFKYSYFPTLPFKTFFLKFLKEDLLDEDFINKDYQLEEVLELINRVEIDAESKLSLINLYIGGEKLFSEIKEVINELIVVFKKHFWLVQNEFEKLFNNLQNKEFINEFLNNYFKGKLYTGEEVKISIVSYNQMYYSIFDGKRVMLFGLYLNEIINFTENKESEEEVLEILKSLSNPTRFKIIKLLKSERKYASEIAKELTLSAATINHHLNNLVNLKILIIVFQDEDNKKVFYELNNTRIEEIIKMLRSNLL